METQHIPGTIGAFASKKKIKTRTGFFAHMVENHERMSTKWRGESKRGGGYAVNVTPFPMFRGTTKQTPGLNPWTTGNNVPRIGAPMGVHYDTDEKLGCDPLSWHRAGMIGNPSIAFMSTPSAGKSTAMRVMMRGLTAHGTINMIIGDVKNEHGEQMKKDGGTHCALGPSLGCLNVLDPGNIRALLAQVDATLGDTPAATECKAKLIEDLHQRRSELTCALLSIQRGENLTRNEEGVVYTALKSMYEAAPHRVPILEDLRAYVKDPVSDDVKDAMDWDGDTARYLSRVDRLRLDLAGLCRSGILGPMFNGQTTVNLNADRGIVFDVSALRQSPPETLAAAYLVAWIVSFGIIEASHTLADYGVTRRREYMAWMDEFWLPLSASKGIVDRVNRVGRTNRTDGVGYCITVHTMDDFKALRDDEDRAKAAGMINRTGMQWFGGLPEPELEKISEEVVRLPDTAAAQLKEWYNPAFEEEDGLIPGRGCFAIVRGSLPIIPVRVILTETEIRQRLHDTNKRMFDQATA